MNKCCLWIVRLWHCIHADGGPDYQLCRFCILQVQARIELYRGIARASRLGGINCAICQIRHYFAFVFLHADIINHFIHISNLFLIRKPPQSGRCVLTQHFYSATNTDTYFRHITLLYSLLGCKNHPRQAVFA